MLLDQYAKHLIGIGGNEPITPERQSSYRETLNSLKKVNPTLGAASETSYITGSDWRLLSLLMPDLSKEIEKSFGAKPLINYTKDGKKISEDIRQCMRSSTNSLDQIRCYF